jgi:hypothetical protein
MSAILYRADGTQQEVTPANGTDFTIQELYSLIGCQYVEMIDCGESNMIMIGDEESKLHDDFVVNERATKIYRDGNGIKDPKKQYAEMIAGFSENVIFFGDPNDENPFTIAGDVIYMPSTMIR